MRRTIVAAALLAAATLPAKAESYVNVFAGAATFDSTVTVGGVKLIDQGGDALSGGLRVGWGMTQQDVYYGLEAEGFLAHGRSRAVVNGNVYSWELRGGLGAYGRFGWRTGDAIFYGRGGVLALDTNQGWETRPAVGGGAEVPFGPGWAFRVDVTYSWSSGPEVYQGTIGITRRF